MLGNPKFALGVGVEEIGRPTIGKPCDGADNPPDCCFTDVVPLDCCLAGFTNPPEGWLPLSDAFV